MKSVLLYLLIAGLVFINVCTIAVFPLSTYVIYAIIIFVVLYFSEGAFWGKNATSGLLLGSVLMGAVFAVEVLAGWIKVEGFNLNPALFFLLFILAFLIAAGEELSFRGYILKNMIEETGTRKGIFLTSLMFSAIHIPSFVYYGLDVSRGTIAFLVVGILSTIVAIIYLEHGLFSAIGFHFVWNFLQYNIFSLSEIQPGLLKSLHTGPVLLTGGNYGPEAGLLGFGIVLISLVVLVRK